MIKLKLSSQLIGQFGHVTASASCKQPEKHGISASVFGSIRNHVRMEWLVPLPAACWLDISPQRVSNCASAFVAIATCFSIGSMHE